MDAGARRDRARAAGAARAGAGASSSQPIGKNHNLKKRGIRGGKHGRRANGAEKGVSLAKGVSLLAKGAGGERMSEEAGVELSYYTK